MTIPSDSEQYSGNDDLSPSPPSSSDSPPMILYTPPTLWGLVRGAAINLLLPFINGLMLGFGELFAHEAAFRLGWGGTKVRASYWSYSRVQSIVGNAMDFCCDSIEHCSTITEYSGTLATVRPVHLGIDILTFYAQVFPGTRSRHSVGPGIEIRDDPMEKRRREGRDLDDITSLE